MPYASYALVVDPPVLQQYVRVFPQSKKCIVDSDIYRITHITNADDRGDDDRLDKAVKHAATSRVLIVPFQYQPNQLKLIVTIRDTANRYVPYSSFNIKCRMMPKKLKEFREELYRCTFHSPPRLLAIAQGQHSRLGSASPFQQLPPEAMRIIIQCI
jgi:hypothetical protein